MKPQTTAATPRSARVQQFESPYVEILGAARRAQTPAEFYRAALQVITRYFRSPYSVLTMRMSSELVEEEAHVGATDPGFWRASVQEFLTESLSYGRTRARVLSAKRAELRLGLIAVPLHLPSGDGSGGVALVLKLREDELRERAALLESLAALVSGMAALVGRGTEPAAARTAEPNSALSRAAAMESVEQLAFALTASVRNKFDCQQASLALVDGARVELLSISGLERIRERNPGVKLIRAALEECVDHAAPIRLDQEHTQPAFRLHQQWRAAAQGAAVASIPLRIGSRIAAVLAVRRAAERAMTDEHLQQIQGAVEPYAAALWMLRAARRGLWGHTNDALRAQWRRLAGPGHVARKCMVLGVAAGLAWFCFGTLEYRAPAPCRITPAGARQIAMPIDGRLAEARALPGDRVAAGQVLCVLDQRELDLERRALEGECEAARLAQAQAQAADKPVEARLAEAHLRQAAARLEIVGARIEQATIRAPFDGVVVEGDLRPRIGEVLAHGASLLQFAPGNAWTLELDVPQHVADELQAGQVGRFASAARPEDGHAFVLMRVRPGAEARDGRAVYVAEAAPAESADWMRSGLEGVARIDVGRRPVWWLTLHRLLDWLRMGFWL